MPRRWLADHFIKDVRTPRAKRFNRKISSNIVFILRPGKKEEEIERKKEREREFEKGRRRRKSPFSCYVDDAHRSSAAHLSRLKRAGQKRCGGGGGGGGRRAEGGSTQHTTC